MLCMNRARSWCGRCEGLKSAQSDSLRTPEDNSTFLLLLDIIPACVILVNAAVAGGLGMR